MKKLILAFVAFISVTIAFAQSTEVVYLKNGSVIKGTVTEQNMSEQTIKLRTADGSIFVYKIDDIDKIEKATPAAVTQQQTSPVQNTGYSAPTLERDTYLKRGYRGFAGVSAGSATGWDSEISFFTTHGVQCNYYYYVGWGLKASVLEEDYYAVNLYVDDRIDFCKGGVSPFIDAKLGYTVGDLVGFYEEATFGVRLKRVNLGVGCSVWNDDGDKYASYFFSFTIDFGARR